MESIFYLTGAARNRLAVDLRLDLRLECSFLLLRLSSPSLMLLVLDPNTLGHPDTCVACSVLRSLTRKMASPGPVSDSLVPMERRWRLLEKNPKAERESWRACSSLNEMFIELVELLTEDRLEESILFVLLLLCEDRFSFIFGESG